MARPGTKRCKEILEGVMAEFDVDLACLRSRSRTESQCRAKQAFVVRCGAEQIMIVVMADVLGLGRAAIEYRLYPEVRKQRRQYDLRNPRRYRPRRAKSEVSAAVFQGAW